MVGLPLHLHMAIILVERDIHIDGFRKLLNGFRAGKSTVVLSSIAGIFIVIVFELVIRLNGEVVAAEALANGRQLERVRSGTVVACWCYLSTIAIVFTIDIGIDGCSAIGVLGATDELIGDCHRAIGRDGVVSVPLNAAHRECVGRGKREIGLVFINNFPIIVLVW